MLEIRLINQPRDGTAARQLAMVHHLAFSVQAREFKVFPSSTGPVLSLPLQVARLGHGEMPWPTIGKPWARPMLVHHALRGISAYETALELDPTNATIWVAYASLLEDVWSFCFAKPPELYPTEFQKIRIPYLREVYSTALMLGLTDYLRTRRGFYPVDSSVMESAAGALVRLEKAAKPVFTAEQREALSAYVWTAASRRADRDARRCGGPSFWPERLEDLHLSPPAPPGPR